MCGFARLQFTTEHLLVHFFRTQRWGVKAWLVFSDPWFHSFCLRQKLKQDLMPPDCPEASCSSPQLHQEEVLLYVSQQLPSETSRYNCSEVFSLTCVSTVCVSHQRGSFLFFWLRWWRFIYSAPHVPRIDVTSPRRWITACLAPARNPHLAALSISPET